MFLPKKRRTELKSLLVYSHPLDLPQTHTCLSLQGNVSDSYTCKQISYSLTKKTFVIHRRVMACVLNTGFNRNKCSACSTIAVCATWL